MNTSQPKDIPHLPKSRHRDYVIVLDDLEFVFSKKQLKIIADKHNSGEWAGDIAKEIKRNEYEVLMAIVHLHKKGRVTRELAFRRK